MMLSKETVELLKTDIAWRFKEIAKVRAKYTALQLINDALTNALEVDRQEVQWHKDHDAKP